jgi:purine-binding chemotaxis protein CheW
MQVVRFNVSGTFVALPVSNVREVVPATHISTVFRSPEFVVGLMNVRGHAVPVLDLACLFGLPASDLEQDMVVIAESGAYVAGLLAQKPVDILDVPDDTEALPTEGSPSLAALDRVLMIEGNSVLVLSAERMYELPQLLSLRQETDLIC